MNQYPPCLLDLEKMLKTHGFEYRIDTMSFWDSPEVIQWLGDHGYTLYKRIYEGAYPTEHTVPSIFFDEDLQVEGHYPYAYYDARLVGANDIPLQAKDFSGKVAYAQDSHHRHVAIKVVLNDSEEYRIARFLNEQGSDTLQGHCVIPVLDLVPFERFWFVVMPRWGKYITQPETHTMRQLLHIMHSMLKGLSFLHAYNIIHRDIKMDNVLINHFGDDECFIVGNYYHYPSPREELRKEGKLSYVLMDFDLSNMVSPDVKKEEYRRPYIESFDGSFNQPYDTRQGEFDYNPFAFDVGCLGVEFCNYYQHYAPHIPMLAPLLDKMTFRDVANRFTATEALQFFEEMYSGLTEDQLEFKEFTNPLGYTFYDNYDRWRDLPEDFRQKWTVYRQPPLSLTTRALRAICNTEYTPYYIVPSIRWFFFKLMSPPRFIWSRVIAFMGFVKS
ncbi:kinase-like domain-containing protein [Pholiota molesta]|nr:kinase-like domain-containing protein [Pholiota molesta]